MCVQVHCLPEPEVLFFTHSGVPLPRPGCMTADMLEGHFVMPCSIIFLADGAYADAYEQPTRPLKSGTQLFDNLPDSAIFHKLECVPPTHSQAAPLGTSLNGTHHPVFNHPLAGCSPLWCITTGNSVPQIRRNLQSCVWWGALPAGPDSTMCTH